MAGSDITWDEASLDEFLKKPKAFLKGTKMSFGGLKKDEQRADLIAYLKTQGM
jgi:cytochrome c